MKKMIILMASFLTFAANANVPVTAEVPVDHIYSPYGFDSNDNSEVIVAGYLPNLCYKNVEASVKVKGKKVEVTMTALKYEESEMLSCPEMAIPYVQPVSLGILDKGLYKVVVNEKTKDSKKGTLLVNESTSNAIDDYVYANVEYVEKAIGKQTVVLKGYNPSSCFEFDSVEFYNNGKDAYSVLPKMRQISDHCPMKMVPFAYEVEVPSDLKKGTVLLHVRSMNGKSVNTLFNNN